MYTKCYTAEYRSMQPWDAMESFRYCLRLTSGKIIHMSIQNQKYTRVNDIGSNIKLEINYNAPLE